MASRSLLAAIIVVAILSSILAAVVAPSVAGATSPSDPATTPSPVATGTPWLGPGVVYDQNFADPDVIYDPTTDTYWGFATTTGASNMPVIHSRDLITWYTRDDHGIRNPAGFLNDGLPYPAPPEVTWSTGDAGYPHPIWAPGVGRVGNRWVAFYAIQVDATGRHCVAYATSDSVSGPYLDPHMMLCSSDPQGSIDPNVFTDPANGVTYLIWKDQGLPNVYGQRSWARPIVMADATTVAWGPGSAPTMLFESSGSWEAYSAENPSLVRMDDGGLALFWSGNEWNTDRYGVGFARCSGLAPSDVPVCTRVDEAPVMSRRQGEKGIGGSAAFRGRGGQLYVADHYWAEDRPAGYPGNQRYLVVDRVDVLGGRLVFSHEPAPTSMPVASGYAPRAPVRVLDTRIATGTTMVRRTEPGEVFVVDVAGVTSASARAVTVNLTVTSSLGDGFATAYECGAPPYASNINAAAGATASNLATVRLDDARHFCVLTSASSHLIVDVQGEWSATADGRVSPVTPARLADTRIGGGPVAAGGQIEVPVTGRAGIAPGATAAIVSLTSTGTFGAGYLTAWSCDGARPMVSNVNHDAGTPTSNTAIVPLSARGTICVSSLVASHVVVDVFGSVSGGWTSTGSLLTVSRPVRMIDTRDRGAMVGATETQRVHVAPAGSRAASLVVTSVESAGPSWVAVFACDAQPARGAETSVLNVGGGETRAAHVVVPVDPGGDVCVRPLTAMHVIVDRSGVLA